MKKKFDFSNFCRATVADWSRCEIPDRNPDYVSHSGSAYWDEGSTVRRLSDHWGKVATCKWFLEGEKIKVFTCAECPYEEFRLISVAFRVPHDEELEEIENESRTTT